VKGVKGVTVSSHIVRAIFAGAAACDLDLAALGERFSVGPEILADVDGRVPLELILELWRELPRLTGKEHFGLIVAQAIQQAPMAIVGYLMQSARTLGEGVAQAYRYERILQDATRSEMVRRGDVVVLRHPGKTGRAIVPGPAVEYGFASGVFLSRRGTGIDDLAPRGVRFEHPAPGDDRPYRELFRCPVFFGAECNELEMDASVMELPLRTADPHLQDVLESHARHLLEKMPASTGLAGRVRTTLCDLITQREEPTLEAVARKTRMHERSIQRHLRDEGTSHQKLLDEVRRELALRYLKDPEMGIHEVAFLLGFSDQSTFHRAFVRWVGTTPGKFRSA
jgi:AraC-like DNA-binding protein